MLAEEMYSFRNYLNEQGIILCYSGFLTEEVLTGPQSLVFTQAEKRNSTFFLMTAVFSYVGTSSNVGPKR